MRTILETADTQLLDALRDVNTIETLREKLMSDRSTQMPLEKKIPFALGGGGGGGFVQHSYMETCVPYFGFEI